MQGLRVGFEKRTLWIATVSTRSISAIGRSPTLTTSTRPTTRSNTPFPLLQSNSAVSSIVNRSFTSQSTSVTSTPISTPTLAPTSSQPPNTALTSATTPSPPAPMSFHRRPLPAALIAFSSAEGRKLFKEALDQGYMEGYFTLAEQYNTQQEPAYCGLASLSMCLNALNIDPNRLWKAPWRWFTEDMLDCCLPIDLVKKRGVSFEEFSCLGRCNGAIVQSIRAKKDPKSIEEFRHVVEQSCSGGEHYHIVASYSRRALEQTGDGHYSPIGGYHKEKDLVLLMDVARFKHPPHWVSVSALWNAMCVVDTFTQQSRGYFLLSKNPKYATTASLVPSTCDFLCKNEATNSPNSAVWRYIGMHFDTAIPALLQEFKHTSDHPKDAPKTIEDVVSLVLSALPSDVTQLLSDPHHATVLPADDHSTGSCSVSILMKQIRETEMYKIVKRALKKSDKSLVLEEGGNGGVVEMSTLLLLACPSRLFSSLRDNTLRDELVDNLRHLHSMPPLLQNQVMQIRELMYQYTQRCLSCPANEQLCKLNITI